MTDTRKLLAAEFRRLALWLEAHASCDCDITDAHSAARHMNHRGVRINQVLTQLAHEQAHASTTATDTPGHL